MRPALHARLVNGPFDDAGLYIQFRLEKHAVLFDLGEINALSAREVLKLSHIFVSHTHMDHFAGFDRLLRIVLGRPRMLYLYGPSGFTANIAGKLAGYTWNLLNAAHAPLTLHITEVHPKYLLRQIFSSTNRFAAGTTLQVTPFSGCLLTQPGFRVDCAILDHHIPSLAFSLQEPFHINIMANRLADLKLHPGPWLNDFKKALYEGNNPAETYVIPAAFCQSGNNTNSLGQLAERIAHVSAGQKISYVVDAAGHRSNMEKIVALADRSDQLFIESVFLTQHRQQARTTAHLTAAEAGLIAARARVKQFIPFHFSSRYMDRETLLVKEAEEAFAQYQGVPARLDQFLA